MDYWFDLSGLNETFSIKLRILNDSSTVTIQKPFTWFKIYILFVVCWCFEMILVETSIGVWIRVNSVVFVSNVRCFNLVSSKVKLVQNVDTLQNSSMKKLLTSDVVSICSYSLEQQLVVGWINLLDFNQMITLGCSTCLCSSLYTFATV